MSREGRERGGREMEGEGTGTGPQFEKNDPPPSSDGWLRACYVTICVRMIVVSSVCRRFGRLLLSLSRRRLCCLQPVSPERYIYIFQSFFHLSFSVF